MDVDLLLGTEQALMLHSVSIISCILMLRCDQCLLLPFVDEGVGHSQIRQLDGGYVGHVLAMGSSNPSKFKTLASLGTYMFCTVITS